MVTCYDFWSAQVLNRTDVDCLLVGDSLSMVMHGHDSTVYADVELMALARQSREPEAHLNKFVVGDMPFLSHPQGPDPHNGRRSRADAVRGQLRKDRGGTGTG